MSIGVHYSSKTQEWETPIDLFTVLADEFGFTLDACASPQNAKCAVFLLEKTTDWKRVGRGSYGSIPLMVGKSVDGSRRRIRRC